MWQNCFSQEGRRPNVEMVDTGKIICADSFQRFIELSRSVVDEDVDPAVSIQVQCC
jgi:hypothetical protein